MGGIISGGLVGGPVGTFLIERQALRKARSRPLEIEVPTAANIVENQIPEPASDAPADEDKESYVLLKNLVAIMMAMWIGSWVSSWFASMNITLPAYIGAMLTAAIIRNLDDRTHWIKLSQRTIDDIGNVALSLFLVLAIMTLEGSGNWPDSLFRCF